MSYTFVSLSSSCLASSVYPHDFIHIKAIQSRGVLLTNTKYAGQSLEFRQNSKYQNKHNPKQLIIFIYTLKQPNHGKLWKCLHTQRPHSNSSHISPRNFKTLAILSHKKNPKFASWFAFEHFIIRKISKLQNKLKLTVISLSIYFSFNFSFLFYSFPLRKLALSYFLKSHFQFSFSMYLYAFLSLNSVFVSY